MGNKCIPISVSHSFAHSAKAVFDAWLDEDTAKHFLFTTSHQELIECEIDARTGGTFIMTDRRAAGDVAHQGVYIEINSPKRLVFSFCVPTYSQEESVVQLDFRPLVQGCEVLLTTDLPGQWADFEAQTITAWKTMLSTLDSVLS